MSSVDLAVELAEIYSRPMNLPVEVIRAARRNVVDTLACAFAGADAAGVPPLMYRLEAWGGAPESVIWGHGLRVPAPEAALANGLMAHALDWDDTHDEAVLHAGVTVIPAAFAAAGLRPELSGAALLEAVTAGVDCACRIGLASTQGPGVSGWLLTPLCGFFGAAVAAGRVLDLSCDRMVNALGIAYAQAAGNGQATIDGALTKRLQAGFAARGGTLAAILAEDGMTGAVNVFEGTRGYGQVYHHGYFDRNAAVHELGQRFEITRLSFKPYPCCRWTHAAIDAALEARASGLRAHDIKQVRVGVTQQAFNSVGQPLAQKQRPRNVVDAQFSLPFVFAAAMIHGEVMPDHFAEAALVDDETLALSGRVCPYVDDDLEISAGRRMSPARVEVLTHAGRKQVWEVARPSAVTDDVALASVLERKFLSGAIRAGYVRDEAGRLLDAVNSLQDMRAADVLGLLAGSVRHAPLRAMA